MQPRGERGGTSTVTAPMEVSRVTSGVPPSVLPHMLGKGPGTARWAAAAAGGKRRGRETRSEAGSSRRQRRVQGALEIFRGHYRNNPEVVLFLYPPLAVF